MVVKCILYFVWSKFYGIYYDVLLSGMGLD